MVIMLLISLILTALLIIVIISGNLSGLIISIIVELIIIIVDYLLGRFKFCKYGLKIKLFEIFKPELEIRISASYLYRIEVKGKYFLVKNSRRNVFQPIGGVYKYYNQAKDFLNSIEYKPDNKIEIDDATTNDLRIRIKAKYISKFLDWFYSNQNRETDYFREFEEEVIQTNILSSKFGKIKPIFIRKVKNKIEYSEYFKCYEIKPKDIISIELTDEQNDELLSLENKNSNEYLFASEEEIINLGIDKNSQEVKFGDHTRYIL